MRSLFSAPFKVFALFLLFSGIIACVPKEEIVPVSGIMVSPGSLSLAVGSSATLTATIYPSEASGLDIDWSSSDPSVATVNNGTVTAVKKGEATILATAGGKAGTCYVVVIHEVESVSIDNDYLTVEVGENLQLTATVIPEDAKYNGIVWSSDNESVATVDENGLVAGIATGTAVITATAGSKSASCSVTVTNTSAEAERAALTALYNEAGGDNWRNKDNWCSDKPLDEWYGVTVTKGRVTGLNLFQNNLTGSIPAVLFSMRKLQKLDLGYNELSGEIPATVGDAEDLDSLLLQHNRLTGTIPESLYGLNKLKSFQAWSNELSGELSERFWDMPSLEWLLLEDNHITGQLTPAVKRAKKLKGLGLADNRLKGTIPAEITELSELWDFNLSNSSISNGSITTGRNEISGTIPEDLDKIKNLRYFLASNLDLEGNVPACFARLPKLTGLEIFGNRLSGEIPAEVVECANWEGWTPEANILPQQEGYTLTFKYYESTDFSRDGEVVKLQTHENGNGINLVITGDCFVDKDITEGLFEGYARDAMEYFFELEPFATFRNLFDVYAVTTVSKTRYSDYGTALGAVIGGGGSYVGCDEAKVREYTLKAVDNLHETLTIVLVNKNADCGTAYMPEPIFDTDYGSGFSYVCLGLPDTGWSHLIQHEAGGHGFTKLGDEYFYRGNGACPEETKQSISSLYFARGYYANLDFEPDPAKVKWARLLADERYKNDGIGIFEGGMLFETGVWRPSENSLMAYNLGGLNAPSRMAAYIRIHKLAFGSGWQFDYEEFVKYDAVNRKN